MTRDLFVASWNKGAPDAWVVRLGLTSLDYQTAFDDFMATAMTRRG